jgi:glucuronoarabinoxylan endo-1,4-beta-xylanase
MVAFVKVLGPKLKALNPPVKLVSGESTTFEDLWGTEPNKGGYNYGVAILADSAASAAVDILGTHQYETQDAVAPPAGVSKPIWQTEMSGVQGFPEEGPSSDMPNGLAVAKWIHEAIAIGMVSSWQWWWWLTLNPDNEGLLLKDGSETRRLYVLGNFSKFIRPGYQRVVLSGTLPTNVLVTGYKNPTDGTLVIVAINSNTAAAPVSFFISGNTPCSMTPWVTAAKDNLTSKDKVSISDGRLSVSLAAQSVTTFVGKP